MNRDYKILTVLRAIRNYGTVETFLMVWSVLVNKGAKRLFLVALSTPRPVTKALKTSQKHTFKFATIDELNIISASLEHDPDNKPSEKDINLVANGKARCMLQMDGTKLAGYAWIWNSKIAHICDGYYINLPDDTIYNFKGYTPVEYRGFGYQALRHTQLLRLLKGEGIKRLFGYVDRTNPRSLRGVKKSGYKKVGELLIGKAKNSKIKISMTLNEDFWVNKPRV